MWLQCYLELFAMALLEDISWTIVCSSGFQLNILQVSKAISTTENFNVSFKIRLSVTSEIAVMLLHEGGTISTVYACI
jgi:hypothetical protein